MASTFHNIGWIILIVIFVSHGSSFPQTIAIQDTVTDSSPLGESSDPFDIVATDQTEAVLSQSDSDNDGLYPLADTSDCSPKNLGKRHVNDIQGGTWISKNPSAACDATIEGARRLGREPTRRAKPAPLPAIPSSRIQNKQLCPRGKFPKCCEFPASQIVLYKNAGYIIATCGSFYPSGCKSGEIMECCNARLLTLRIPEGGLPDTVIDYPPSWGSPVGRKFGVGCVDPIGGRQVPSGP